MKERLILLYRLSRIDKELQELNSLKGDIPARIEELTSQRNKLQDEIDTLQSQLDELIADRQNVLKENETLTARIDKNDNLLRAGAVKSNDEYNALAKEIEEAYEKIDANERQVEDEFKGKTARLETQLLELKTKFEEIDETLTQNQAELRELSRQTEEEENELKGQRDKLARDIDAEDIEFYDRVNNSKFGDAVAIVRKGSCLGCFSSIPPQRSIEIRMANRFFNCEACGRILIAEELIAESGI